MTISHPPYLPSFPRSKAHSLSPYYYYYEYDYDYYYYYYYEYDYDYYYYEYDYDYYYYEDDYDYYYYYYEDDDYYPPLIYSTIHPSICECRPKSRSIMAVSRS